MLPALKFVRGAVAKKDFQPALTHFRISGGRVMGFDGIIALSSPIDLDLEATPKAVPFVKAIERCESTTAITLTPSNRLFIKSGRFKVHVECTDESEVLDAIQPEGEPIPMGAGLIPAVKALKPFVGTDASRPWAMGILLRDKSAFATNNIILAEHWIGYPMPNVNLPVSAINELARIGEEPIGVRLGEHSITFYFEGDRWLRSQLLSTEWPDIGALLNVASQDADMKPVPEGLYEAVETVKPFLELEGRVYFRDGTVTTFPEEGQGAVIEVPGVPAYGAYHHKHLLSLDGVAEVIDFTKHPQPCPFQGSGLRGVFLGMTDA